MTQILFYVNYFKITLTKCIAIMTDNGNPVIPRENSVRKDAVLTAWCLVVNNELEKQQEIVESQSGVVEEVYYEAETAQENTLAGVVGAFLFSLVGGVVAFILAQIGYVAAISGLVTIILAIFGYGLFSGTRKSGKPITKKTIIICALITAVTLLAAEYVSWAYAAYQEFVVYDETITLFDCLRIFPMLLVESELVSSFLLELLLSYGLAAIGCYSYIKNLVTKNNYKKRS